MMFGGFTDMPSLFTYKQALRHHDSIKPLRGRSVRPICNTKNGRRKTHMTIRAHEPHLLEKRHSVTCEIYGVEALRFFDDETVEVNVGLYSGQAVNAFISSILYPLGYVYQKNYQPRFCLNVGEKPATYGTVYAWEESPFEDRKITLKQDNENNRFRYHNKPVMYGYYLRRKLMKEKRAQVAEFVKYAKALAKMVDPSDYRNHRSRECVTAATAWQMMADRDRWSELLPIILHDCCEWSRYDWVQRMNPDRVQKYVDEAIKHTFSEELFELREMKDKPNENGNDRYMLGGNTSI